MDNQTLIIGILLLASGTFAFRFAGFLLGRSLSFSDRVQALLADAVRRAALCRLCPFRRCGRRSIISLAENAANRGAAGCGGSDGAVAGSRCGITHCWPGMMAAGRYAASPEMG